MTTMDTHAVVKQLIAAGFTNEQAEAVTLVVRDAQDVDLSNLVTKTEYQAGLAASKADLQAGLAASKADLQAGLAATKADLQAGLASVRSDLATTKADLEKTIAESKADILKWMIGMIGMQTAVILGAALTIAHMIR